MATSSCNSVLTAGVAAKADTSMRKKTLQTPVNVPHGVHRVLAFWATGTEGSVPSGLGDDLLSVMSSGIFAFLLDRLSVTLLLNQSSPPREVNYSLK